MKLPRYLMPALLIAPVACALIAAPPAAAGCYSSGDTEVCGQGNVRGRRYQRTDQGRRRSGRNSHPMR